MAEKAAERIKFATEVLRFTSLLMVGTGGGILPYTGVRSGELAVVSQDSAAYRTPHGGCMTGIEWLALAIAAGIMAVIGVYAWAITKD